MSVRTPQEDIRIHQQIYGDRNQIAVRDVINEGDSFRPDPSKPGIFLCKMCGWPLSVGADECPKCAHNYQADRLAAQEQARQENEKFLQNLLSTIVLVLVGGIFIMSQTGLNFLEALVTMTILTGISWYGWMSLVIRVNTWLDRKPNG